MQKGQKKKKKMTNNKNPVLSVVDGKICINGRVFDVHE